ncbi:DUF4301 family protein [Gillisia sp. Hel_I_29]|uniref:DUF4301 family protein n=1 Tax=Gillisia sp. Hel_I_29 TaxID=1249975 RepID=UPI000555DD9B|nr:DUF4301 family protein [Gillisia sp. Hel_I_29]
MNFTQADIQQIENKGIALSEIEEQLKIFSRGNLPVNIAAAATVGDGIKQYSEARQQELKKFYEDHKSEYKILKFVPASGAATRMFKAIHVFLNEFDPEREELSNYLKKIDNDNLNRFFRNFEKLPFFKESVEFAKKDNSNFADLADDKKKVLITKAMLFSPGLDLCDHPKGLVPFHKYGDLIATAFEEHLYEAALYSEVNGECDLHFTVSEEHKEKFENEYNRILERVNKKTGINFKVTYSYQNPKTDTIAVNKDNTPFRTVDNELFFRPGGHGALIENLNNLDADVVFIKNIDNVVKSSEVDNMASFKKVLGGKLLLLQDQCFEHLINLDNPNLSDEELEQIKVFLNEKLNLSSKEDFSILSKDEKIKYLQDKLNRPLRVCGMVKNEGEPGGGPFLVKMENGERSLQIIESAQIDTKDIHQNEIAQNATHFNPVDLVCGIKDYQGNLFDLNLFVDPTMSFIAEKTKDGKPLRALERPGLWNGAMAKWNTVFVEVPVQTFNPVKTVSDLLKASHQMQ